MKTIADPPSRLSDAPLSDEQLRAALTDLPEWRGNTARLTRTIIPSDLWPLLERVAAVEQVLDHHTVVDLDAGAVTFAVWTHTCDAVTPADIELARRIDAVVAEG